jgi:hypothetical protein
LPHPSISTPMIANLPISCQLGHTFSRNRALNPRSIGAAIRYRAVPSMNGGITSTPNRIARYVPPQKR